MALALARRQRKLKKEEFILQLIELVKKYPLLYSTYSNSVDDRLSKKCIWIKIAMRTNRSVKDCQKIWARLRRNYTSAKRGRLNRPFKFAHALCFLDYDLFNATVVTLDMLTTLINIRNNNQDFCVENPDPNTVMSLVNKSLPPLLEYINTPVTSSTSVKVENIENNTTSSRDSTNVEGGKEDSSEIANQFKNTEQILRKQSEDVNDDSDEGSDIVNFLEEMGDYVANRFTYQEQKEIRHNIWLLLTTEYDISLVV